MKKITILLLLVLLTGCSRSVQEDWGSFTQNETYSYDNAFYAVQSVEKDEVIVDVYKTETDEKIYSFSPARARDFWGICWESDTYNIWIQSADIGVLCYEFKNNEWVLNENAERPTDIISKHDWSLFLT